MSASSANVSQIRRTHLLSALLALLSSLGLHIAAFKFFPSFELGRPALFSQEQEKPHILLGKVQREFSKPVSQHEPPPSNKNDLLEKNFTQTLTRFREVMHPFIQESEQSIHKTLHEQLDAKIKPELKPPELEWSTRQEILSIEKPLLADQSAPVPRLLVPDIPRAMQAPDISLPLNFKEKELQIHTPPISSKNRQPQLSMNQANRLLDVLLNAPTEKFSGTVIPSKSKIIQEAATLLDERPEEISTFIPAEDLLEFNLTRYEDPSDKGDYYFKIEILRQGIEALPVIARDFIYIQDCSESISRSKLAQCKKGLLQSLEHLNENDRFNIMSFRDEAELCFKSFIPVSKTSLARARLFINQMRSRGKTDVNKSLEKISQLQSDPSRPLIALLITDGRPTQGLIDNSEIIEAFSHNNQGEISLFAIGGGKRANKYLLDLMSYRNRGEALLAKESKKIPNAVNTLSEQIRNPVLSALQYRFANGENIEVYPETLTHLYLDRPLVLYGKIKQAPPDQKLAFQIVGSSGTLNHDIVFSPEWENANEAIDSEIRNQWALHKMYFLIGKFTESKNQDYLGLLKNHALTYNLQVPYVQDMDAPISQ